MKKQMFDSKFWLNFKDSKLKENYPITIQKSIILSNQITYPILAILSIGELIFLIANNSKNDAMVDDSNKSKRYYFIALCTLNGFFSVIDIIFIVLIFLKKTHNKLQSVLGCISYIMIMIYCINFKILFEVIADIKTKRISSFSVIEYIFRILWYIFSTVQFSQTFVINIVVPICILILFFLLDEIKSVTVDYGISYIGINIGLIFISYLITKILKKKSFYLFEAQETNRKHEVILNCLNIGYMQVGMGKIILMNDPLMKTLSQTKLIQQSPYFNISRQSSLMENPGLVFEVLFTGIASNDDLVNTEETAINPGEGLESILLRFRKIWDKRVLEEGDKEKFIFLNHCKIELNIPDYNNENKTITYEILFKYTFDEFEFIFNDITRTRQYEQREYNWKIKNVFLTKIAHEFRNPLVCIQELIDQIQEIPSDTPNKNRMDKKEDKETNLQKKCQMVKSFADYLLLLIQDLDYFSTNNAFDDDTEERIHKCKIGIEKVNLEEIASFCFGVVKTKLMELSKEKTIEFSSFIQNDIPKIIFTDSMKLKQILCNLLSNSVKFTNKGKIKLEIVKSSIDNYIAIFVKDTGVGIINEKKVGLVTSVKNKANSIDDIPQIGIGLSIVRDLTNYIGTEIQFNSDEGCGSQFWFNLPVNIYTDVTNNNISLTSSKILNRQKSIDEMRSSKYEINLQVRPDPNELPDENNITKDYIESINTSVITEIQEPIFLKSSSREQIIPLQRKMKIIVADDEILARKALIRTLTEEVNKMNIELNIIEAKDGIETLFELFQTNGHGIDCIISDQKMKFINGSTCFNILTKEANYLLNIPFFIVTAYNSNATYFNGINCQGIYSKPLRKCNVNVILNKLILNMK